MVYINGRLPDSALEHLNWPEEISEELRPDAAESIDRLAVAFHAAFGTPLRITDSYRSYAEQVLLKVTKGALAATPGTSNHGLGIAIDMASGINSDGSTTHKWMEQNGPRYGWINPDWAQDYNPRNGAHEAWHWEYHPELDTHPIASIKNVTTHVISMPLYYYQEDTMSSFVTEVLTDAYNLEVGRNPSDAVEIAPRRIRIALGQSTLASEVSSIDKSVESNRWAVHQLYAELLSRPGSPSEWDGWISGTGNDVAKIRAGLIGSAEYKKLHPLS